MISICFVFPYVGQGGVPVLFSQLANYLDTNKLARVSIVDYADGSLFKLTNSSVKKIIYNPFHSTHIKSDFLVFQVRNAAAAGELHVNGQDGLSHDETRS